MVKVGFHVSIAGSIEKAVERAENGGCDCFQMFTRSPRVWKAKEITDEAALKFKKAVKKSGISPVVVHMPYLPNLAAEKKEIYQKSVMTLTEELERCEKLSIPYLVTHLGHNIDTGAGRDLVVSGILKALEQADSKCEILLENTAGEKNSVGSRFEEIEYVFGRVESTKRVGICFDTCHAFAAGYDLSKKEAVYNTVKLFDEIIGIKNLKVIHLNDSLGELGSGRDRHDHIGFGAIGEEGFYHILHHSKLMEIPLILETPVDERCSDLGNIEKVRELASLP